LSAGNGIARNRKGSDYRQPSIRISRFTSGLPKVVILHTLAVVSEVLGLLLEDRVDVVATTDSGNAAVSLSELHVPDVVVIGDVFSDGVAEYYIPALLQTGTRILLVSQSLDSAGILGMAELGVTGIVDHNVAPHELAEAVMTLVAGGATFPADVINSIAAEWRRSRRLGSNGVHTSHLTDREVEVLGAMSDGLSTKAIAHHLGISVKTVENHKTRIFGKLGVRTQAQAVALVIGSPSTLLGAESSTAALRSEATHP